MYNCCLFYTNFISWFLLRMAKMRFRLGVVMLMGNETKLLVFYLSKVLPGLQKVTVSSHMLTIQTSRETIELVSVFLKKSQQLRFDCLLDIWGIDYTMRALRFEINYLLLSINTQKRLVLRTSVSEKNLRLPTLSNTFNSANWLEREVWDMFGVVFMGHPDLRRILTDYGFEGHPLRKDFPLNGFSEVRYDDGDKRIVYEPLETAQEYRSFFFKGNWGKSL